MNNYELHGIPSTQVLNHNNLPEYAQIYNSDNINYPFKSSTEPTIINMTKWALIDSWSEVEASLLLSNLIPDDPELYAISKSQSSINKNKFDYAWKYTENFTHANECLFILKKSILSPKAPPSEWVKYFYKKIISEEYNQYFVTDYYHFWIDYFEKYLKELITPQMLVKEKELTTTERNTLLIIIGALIKENKLDINKPSKTATIISKYTEGLGAKVDDQTILNKLNEIRKFEIDEAIEKRSNKI